MAASEAPLEEPFILWVTANVSSISEIDTVAQTFKANIKYKLQYLASQEDIEKQSDEKSDESLSPKDDDKPFEPSWIPKVTFPSATEVEINVPDGLSEHFQFGKNKNGDDIITYDFQINSTFQEPFELQNFPFDCQDLAITLKSGNLYPPRQENGKKRDCVFMPSPKTNVFGRVDLEHSVFNEWKAHNTMIEFGRTDKAKSKSGKKSYPLFIIRVKVERKWEFYFHRIVIILMALSLSTLTSYSLSDPGDHRADRLGIDFTVLLTVVAYQYTVQDSLPVLPFLTVMDMFIVASIGFVFAITVQHSLISAHDEDLDALFLWIFLALWLVVHLLFGIYCPYLLMKERKKLTMDSKQLAIHRGEDDNVRGHRFVNDNQHIKSIEEGKWTSFLSKAE